MGSSLRGEGAERGVATLFLSGESEVEGRGAGIVSKLKRRVRAAGDWLTGKFFLSG